ncbi:phosphatase PAP2 family protein [Leptospirillum ferrooxidans]|jgi:undecaprenyl-diphosphatase|uniref:Putative phosphoesterase, PA-phosphatase related protein n=1 Tax=Leptospirillum ferrooxidans (strain C2-3) TaxID=1162668 RepID=I0IMH8_LEPFC|nr:phosphatase PAP2 family protein [Leptospirillum ferrooxidans]BAM06477.1 putative phosphoesterase, PA-phosphatase related protein [Leptospirillum ferrooxidans C2-3]
MEIFSDLLHFDHQLFLLINGAFPRDWLDPVMTAVTDMGNGAYQFPIGLLILILVSRQHLKRDVPLWASTALLSLLVGELLKKQIARPRPLAYFHDKIVDHQVTVHVVGPHLMANSFPSGHTFSAFSAATLFSGLYPRFSVLLYGLAFLTGISRIYVGAHFPGDVLFGAIIGSLSSWVVLRYLRPKIEQFQSSTIETGKEA